MHYTVIPNEDATDRMVRLMGDHYNNFDGNLFSMFASLAGKAYDGGALGGSRVSERSCCYGVPQPGTGDVHLSWADEGH